MIKVFLKKKEKRTYFYNHCLNWGKFSQANGQKGRGAENTIALCIEVVFLHENGEHSGTSEKNHPVYKYICIQNIQIFISPYYLPHSSLLWHVG